MDYRERKYYFVKFAWHSYDMRMEIIKNIPTVKISSPYLRFVNDRNAFAKLVHSIDFYPQMLVSCRKEHCECLEYELRKAERRDDEIGFGSNFYPITQEVAGQ